MTQEGFKRKLTAILSADVAGYSRLMDDNEEATVLTLTAYRSAMSDLVQQFRGRVVDATGDNLMAEFTSVVDAVNCAVEIQRELAERNTELGQNRKMEFRIGVNLGDVIEEEGRLYGDGVNIAARVEGLAEAGGICISGRAFDQVENKLGLEYEFLGEHEVKNITRPIRVYKIPMEPGAATEAEKEKGASSLPDKPAIAVLPFVNMSNDPEQEYFSDGMTEEIITRLSMNPLLFVIARNSTFIYKGKPVKVQQVGHELGVRYVVEGSVRKAGNMVRITAQLIDATTESHLWAKTYDREFKDIFSLQDEIAHQIVTSVVEGGIVAELSRVRRIPTENLTAYDSLLQGVSHLWRWTKEENAKARKMFERAIELDPDFAIAYVALAAALLNDYDLPVKRDPRTLEQVFKFSRKAISLDGSLSLAHALLAQVYKRKGQFEQAISQAERALSLNPNEADTYLSMGNILSSVGRSEEAVEVIKKAMYLNPHYTANYNIDLATAYRNLGQHKEAFASLKEALALNPDWIVTYVELAQLYRNLGQYNEAIASSNEALTRDPDLIGAYFELAMNYRMAWSVEQNQDPLMLDRALEMAEKLVSIDDSYLGGHFELSAIYLYKQQYEKALAEAEKLIALAPENADSYARLAVVLPFVGRSEEAVEVVEKAMQLNPAIPAWYLNVLGSAYSFSDRQADAMATYKRVFDHRPSHEEAVRAHLGLAILYIALGQEEDARAEAAEVLKLVPNFSVEVWGQREPYKDEAQIEQDMAALRKAGLK
jgi:adenylate cyclase